MVVCGFGRRARTKKPPKIRRHKQKGKKTENPDFVQNGFIKVGIVCEIFIKKSIDKKSCRTFGSPKQNQRGKKHIACILSCKKNPCKKSTARIERVFFIDNKTKVRCY